MLWNSKPMEPMDRVVDAGMTNTKDPGVARCGPKFRGSCTTGYDCWYVQWRLYISWLCTNLCIYICIIPYIYIHTQETMVNILQYTKNRVLPIYLFFSMTSTATKFLASKKCGSPSRSGHSSCHMSTIVQSPNTLHILQLSSFVLCDAARCMYITFYVHIYISYIYILCII